MDDGGWVCVCPRPIPGGAGDDLAIGNSVDRDPRPFHLHSGCGNAVERAPVCAVKGHPGYDFIAFGNLIPYCQMVVREGAADCLHKRWMTCFEILDVIEHDILGEIAVECSHVPGSRSPSNSRGRSPCFARDSSSASFGLATVRDSQSLRNDGIRHQSLHATFVEWHDGPQIIFSEPVADGADRRDHHRSSHRLSGSLQNGQPEISYACCHAPRRQSQFSPIKKIGQTQILGFADGIEDRS